MADVQTHCVQRHLVKISNIKSKKIATKIFFDRSVVPMLLRPKSKGWVRLKSRNPFENARVEAGYFTHPNDMEVLVEAVKFALAMAETSSFKKLGTKFWDKVHFFFQLFPFFRAPFTFFARFSGSHARL